MLGPVYARGPFIALISMSTATPWRMGFAVFGAQFCVSSGQVGANALSAAFYRTPYRPTGVSWANGIGRSGSILGRSSTAGMVALGREVTTIYALVAIPAVIAGPRASCPAWCVGMLCVVGERTLP